MEAIAEMVQAIDRAGIDGVCVTGHATLDPFVAPTVTPTASPRIQLQTHVLVLAYRNPFVVAKAASSLDALSNWRTRA